jgi:hypothetical protein
MLNRANLETKPLSVTIPQASHLTGLGRTKLYELMNLGKIETVAVGRRKLIIYGSLERLINSPTVQRKQALCALPQLDEGDAFAPVRSRLVTTLGAGMVASWFSHAVLDVEGDEARLRVPKQSCRDHIENHFYSEVRCAVAAEHPHTKNLIIEAGAR